MDIADCARIFDGTRKVDRVFECNRAETSAALRPPVNTTFQTRCSFHCQSILGEILAPHLYMFDIQ